MFDDGDLESHLAKLYRVHVIVTQATPIIAPIAKIIACYLEDFVVLVASKDKELGQYNVYAPHLVAQSPVMEMKLVSTETRYEIDSSAAVLREVVRYIGSHKTKLPPVIQKPLRSNKMKDVCVCQWDAWFIDTVAENRQLLYDVILLANALNIQGLLHLACAKVASLIKGQPLQNIQGILSPSTTATTSSSTTTTTTETSLAATSPTSPTNTSSAIAAEVDNSPTDITMVETSKSNADALDAEKQPPKCPCEYH